jgi:hypothetical protein
MLGYYGRYGLVSLVIQVFFAVHAYRRGKPWWSLIIMVFPVVGVLVYLFAEFLPEMRARGTVNTVARNIAHKINPEAEVRRLQDQVELSPTVNNRMELARAYLRAGRTEEAVEVYRGCAQGVYADDPRLLFEMGAAYHAAGDYAAAREAVERLRRQQTFMKPEHLLLSARIAEDAGDVETALADYQALSGRGAGEEPRCRYALLLKRLGREDEARAVFEQMLRHARLSSAQYRKSEKEWLDIARREMKSGAAAE